MSTGNECMFIHVESGWYYVLEHYNAPKNAWDWTEYAVVYGPFTSFEEAHTDLRDNHANPGGFSTPPEDGPPEKMDEGTAALIARAEKPRRYGFWR